MKSKKIFSILAAILIVSGNSFALASNNPVDISAKRANFAAEKQTELQAVAKEKDFIDSIRTKIKNFKGVKKISLDDTKKKNLSLIVSNIFDRLDGILSRLSDFDGKVVSATASKKAAGGDTSEAEAALTIAQSKLSLASTSISNIKTAMSESIKGGTVTKEGIYASLEQASGIVKNVRASYANVLKILTGGKVIEVEPTGSDSATSTDSDPNIDLE